MTTLNWPLLLGGLVVSFALTFVVQTAWGLRKRRRDDA